MPLTENPQNSDKRDYIAARLRGLAEEVLALPSPRHVVFMENNVGESIKDVVTSWIIFISTEPIEGVDNKTTLKVVEEDPDEDHWEGHEPA